MKLFSAVITALLLVRQLSLAAAEPVPVPSQITAVTVYLDRAQVTRTCEVPLVAGENRIALADLPGELEDDSVRATGQAAGAVTLQDVEVRTVVKEQVADVVAKAAADRLQLLRDDVAILDGRQRGLDQRRALLQQIQIKGAGDVSRDTQVNKLDVAQLKELTVYLSGEAGKLEEEALKLAIARRELQPRVAAAEAEFNKRQTAATRTSKTVIVTVGAKEATKLRLQVSYLVGGASWTPTYDARGLVDAGKVEFTYSGIVSQQTGEEWRGVELTLSTARPAVGAELPQLEKWAVNFVQPEQGGRAGRGFIAGSPTVATMSVSGGVATNALASMDGSVQAITPAIPPAEAEIYQGVTAATFRVPRAADIPSDGEPHRQTIKLHALPASFRYETTPKLAAAAFLKATATNSTDAPFLAGPVNVFVGPDFVGTGELETAAPTEALSVYLGTDDAIRVKREELKDRRGKSGLFNRRHKQVTGYKITVENFKDRPQRVVVFEPMPVAGNEEIKVQWSDTATKPTAIDAATGKVTWEFTLQPREKREIVSEFVVDWPQDRQVSGL